MILLLGIGWGPWQPAYSKREGKTYMSSRGWSHYRTDACGHVKQIASCSQGLWTSDILGWIGGGETLWKLEVEHFPGRIFLSNHYNVKTFVSLFPTSILRERALEFLHLGLISAGSWWKKQEHWLQCIKLCQLYQDSGGCPFCEVHFKGILHFCPFTISCAQVTAVHQQRTA